MMENMEKMIYNVNTHAESARAEVEACSQWWENMEKMINKVNTHAKNARAEVNACRQWWRTWRRWLTKWILTLRAPELKWKLVGNGGEHEEDD